MPVSPQSWDDLKSRFDRMDHDPDYKQFKPLLYVIQPWLSVREQAAVVEGLLDLAEDLRGGMQGSVKEAAERIVNRKINVDGSMYQAENIFLISVNQAEREMKLPEAAIEVAVVLVAMTEDEAKALAAGAAFNEGIGVLREDFARLAAHLDKNGIADWASHYGASAEAWCPRGGAAIGQIIADALDTLNQASEFTKPFVAKFHDIRVLNIARPQGRTLLRDLRSKGCIVVVDAISLRHPVLLRAYQRSLLDVYPTTSVVTLTPDGNAFELMKSMVHALQMSLEESELSLRMTDPLEGLTCQEYSDAKKMSGWLIDRVRKICGPAASGDAIRAQMKA